MAEKQDIFQEWIDAVTAADTPEARRLAELFSAPEVQSLLAVEQVQAAMGSKFIMDQMPGGFFIYEATGEERILYANEALVRLFGCATMEEFTELTGGTFPGMVHDEDIEQVELSITDQINESQFDLDYVEYRIVQKDGAVRWIEDYGHFLDTKEGGIFYVFIADATDKREQMIKQHSRELEEVNRELRQRLQIIEGFSIDYESIFYVDLDANKVHPYQLSTRTAKLTSLDRGADLEEVRREYIDMWVIPEDKAVVEEVTDPAYIRDRLGREVAYHTTYRVVENDEMKYLQLRIANVSGDGPISKVVWGYRRVDEEILREMEQRELLENALKRTKAAMEAKNTFLSNMSHDIRTPMNAVVGYAEIAKRNMDDPHKLFECMEKIEESSGQMLRMIGEVLQVSQMESGSIRSEEGTCDVLALLHHVEEKILPAAEEKHVRFSMDCSGVRHKDVYTDAQKLEQVLLRLAGNAIKYTNSGGWAKVTVEEQGASTRDYASYIFRVADNGVGIDPEFMIRIFEPFERRLNTTQSGVLGVGLGLTIAKSMVEMMGGSLTAESEVGQGTTFIVTLPLRMQNTSKHGSRHNTGKTVQRILLVDDNELNRELCAELLSDAGFLIDTAENGLEAVERVRNSKPGEYSLVLMDIQMPVMDGNQAAKAIRTLPDQEVASVPIVALSANAMEEDRKRSMESGMNAHMAKPIQIGELLELLKDFTGRD